MPDAVTISTAGKLLEYGLAGVVILALGFALFFTVKALFSCLNASIERTASLATVIENAKSRDERIVSAQQEVSRRLEAVERRLESLERK